MLTMPSFKKSLIVEQFQGNYLKLKTYIVLCFLRVAGLACFGPTMNSSERSLDSRVCLLIPKVNYRAVHPEKLFS